MITKILLYKCDTSCSERWNNNGITSTNQMDADCKRAASPLLRFDVPVCFPAMDPRQRVCNSAALALINSH